MPDAPTLPDPIGGRAGGLPPALVCSWTDGGRDAAWVHVSGELALPTVPKLVRTLREPQLQARLVVLDLRELVSIDSAGVHSIVDASIRARWRGRRLVVLRGPPNVDRIFALTALPADLEIGDVDAVERPIGTLAGRAEDPRSVSDAAGAP